MGKQVSIRIAATPSAAQVKAAAAAYQNVATSNHLAKNAAELLAAAFKAATLADGSGVEITTMIPVGNSPAYNVGRSRVGSTAYRTTIMADGRSLWESINVTTLIDWTVKGGVITGTPTTTANGNADVRTFLTPR